jgi:hypothetical protein
MLALLTLNALSYMLGFDLPACLRKDAALVELQERANYIVSITNDILSLRRELDQGLLNNICVLLFLRQPSGQKQRLQHAVNEALELVQGAMADFDRIALHLLASYASNGSDVTLQYQLKEFIDGCRKMCTGSITWSYGNKRYGLDEELGSIG